MRCHAIDVKTGKIEAKSVQNTNMEAKFFQSKIVTPRYNYDPENVDDIND